MCIRDRVEEGHIVAVLHGPPPASGEHIDLRGGSLVPGFIDVQVNGGGGVLFNNATSVEALAAIARGHRKYGTTGMLPTLISDDASVMPVSYTHLDVYKRQLQRPARRQRLHLCG